VNATTTRGFCAGPVFKNRSRCCTASAVGRRNRLELARIFNADVETGIKRGLTLLEPLLIIVLGLMIASIIVSILLGILSVNDLAV
jgi:hypothetical protein